jgi:hypothetical protein
MGRLAIEPMHVAARMINFPGLMLQEEHFFLYQFLLRPNTWEKQDMIGGQTNFGVLNSLKVAIHYMLVFSIIYVTYDCSKEIKLYAVPDSSSHFSFKCRVILSPHGRPTAASYGLLVPDTG